MAKTRWMVGTAAAAMLSATAVSAGTLPIVADAATAAPATAATDTTNPALDKIVCKSLGPPPGTRLGDRHICQTEREWEDQRRQHQQDVLHEQKRSVQFGIN